MTRLAQRMTGEMPAVEPRLPLLFEPAARIARSGGDPEGKSSLAAPEPAEPAPAAVSARRPMPATTRPVPGDAPRSGELLRPRTPGVEWIRPSPARAADENRDSADTQAESSPDAAPAPERRPPSQDLTAPPRVVPVEIRPAAVGAAHPPPSATPRHRSGTAGQLNDAAKLTDAGRSAEGTPERSTVHVHIGRVDVRAVMPPAAPSRPTARPAAPRATLEDYLNGRKGGSQP